VLAKKYGSAESGKFVNGVLGAVLNDSPKSNRDRASAPPEDEWEQPSANEELAIEEVTIDESSPEIEELTKAGLWKLRSENPH